MTTGRINQVAREDEQCNRTQLVEFTLCENSRASSVQHVHVCFTTMEMVVSCTVCVPLHCCNTRTHAHSTVRTTCDTPVPINFCKFNNSGVLMNFFSSLHEQTCRSTILTSHIEAQEAKTSKVLDRKNSRTALYIVQR